MPEDKKEIYKSVAPFLNLGLQLALTIGGFVCLGWWLDSKYETSPVWTLVLSVLGFAAGFYNFIRAVLRADKEKKGESKSEFTEL